MGVMKKAWQIAKEAVGKWGGKAREYFALSLKEAWKEYRYQIARAVAAQAIKDREQHLLDNAQEHIMRWQTAMKKFAENGMKAGDEPQIWIQTGASQCEMVWLKEQLEKNKIEKAQAALTAEPSLANDAVTRGSEKQVKWANDLKAKLLPQVKIVEQDMRAKLEAAALDEEKRAKNAAVLESALVEINKKLAALDQHAAKWIDFAANMNQEALARTMWRDAVKAVTSGK